ncbi:MAG: class I SAM-dependent methyltransferase [Nakamurella sp.]
MDWIPEFYSTTGEWWGEAESGITERDLRRVRLVRQYGGAGSLRVLDLGSSYGSTAAAVAQAGHDVTGVEISDRVAFSDRFSGGTGSLTFVKEDFYVARFPDRFDVVCYWNGFGVGSDDDQRRLLARIATEWLRPGGVALVDVSNPFVWASWHGDEEHRTPDAAAGYRFDLRERTTFDPVTCTAVDTWWQTCDPEHPISQTLRCYTPADLALLLGGIGLQLTRLIVGELSFPPSPRPGLSELLRDHHEYLAILHRDP